MSTLEKAIALAAIAHEGQTDKAGAPYILHPLRMMLTLQTPEERMVAVLHDVVEDSAIWRRLHGPGSRLDDPRISQRGKAPLPR